MVESGSEIWGVGSDVGDYNPSALSQLLRLPPFQVNNQRCTFVPGTLLPRPHSIKIICRL